MQLCLKQLNAVANRRDTPQEGPKKLPAEEGVKIVRKGKNSKS